MSSTKAEIDAVIPKLEALWEGVVTGTHQLHCFTANGHTHMKVAETSDSTTFKSVRLRRDSAELLSCIEVEAIFGNGQNNPTKFFMIKRILLN